MLLNLLFWVILILAVIIGVFGVFDILPRATVTNGAALVLFVLIGLRSFRTSID